MQETGEWHRGLSGHGAGGGSLGGLLEPHLGAGLWQSLRREFGARGTSREHQGSGSGLGSQEPGVREDGKDEHGASGVGIEPTAPWVTQEEQDADLAQVRSRRGVK
jgi:hypothetical protein